jgi:hypothetical protein
MVFKDFGFYWFIQGTKGIRNGFDVQIMGLEEELRVGRKKRDGLC